MKKERIESKNERNEQDERQLEAIEIVDPGMLDECVGGVPSCGNHCECAYLVCGCGGD